MTERRQSRWIFRAPMPASLANAPLSARVLWARGYRESDATERFLHPVTSHLNDPFLLRDMQSAAERLALAIRDREPILLYGDYDVDGTTSIVILKKTIDLAGGNASWFIPHRIRDGYGMRPEVIEAAARDGVRLVVSVDTGIRANAVVEHARELGIDVIVTDHHLPEAELPRAVAVVNPNRPDCTYPEKNLCGAAVTFKLVLALLQVLRWPDGRIAQLLDSFLKMVAIATVADVMPLTGENRVIVSCGLAGFTKVANPGLRSLLGVAGIKSGECPSAGQVAFRIAPRINAAGRMATASDVIELFMTSNPARASELAAQLHELNRERQQTEAGIIKSIEELCTEVPVAESDYGLVFSGCDWHKGVVGIVASRVVERYCRPAFVLCEDAETGMAHGSGRSIPAFHLLEALESMRDLFVKFGGHRQAAGVTLPIEAVGEFRSRFNAIATERLSPEDLCPIVEIDAALSLHELNEHSVRDVARLAPFGMGNPAPTFAALDVELAGISIRNERMVNLGLRQNGGRVLFVTAWDWVDRIAAFQQNARVNVALALDDRAQTGDWRANLKDMQPVEATQGLYNQNNQ